MKTLVLEDDPTRARSWVAMFGAADGVVHVAQTTSQARLMLRAGCYDRLCLPLRPKSGDSFALLAVAEAINPDCEIFDLGKVADGLASPVDTAEDSYAVTIG